MRGDEQQQNPGYKARLEEQLDAALRSYADPGEIAEPRVALAKIMARSADRTSQPVAFLRSLIRQPRGWIGAGAAAAVVLALTLAVWIARAPRRAEIAWAPVPPRVVRTTNAPAMLPARPNLRRVRVNRVKTPAVKKPLPKLDVFPSPQPLTRQEQALVAFAKHAPPAVKRAVMEDQKHWDDPMIVAELQKRPLQSTGKEDQ